MSDEDGLPRKLYAICIVFAMLPTITVALRFHLRFKTKTPLWWDDWLILFALIACITSAIVVFIGVAIGGTGRHIPRDAEGNPIFNEKYVIFQKTIYGIDLAQLLALGPTKLSVLFFYRRIFSSVSSRFNFISVSLVTLVILWTISFFLTNTLQYLPVHTQWAQNPADMRPSMDLTRMYLSQSYADVILDVMILILPIPLVWKLHMDLPKKLGVSCLFLLGALATAASIARTVVQYGVAEEFNKGNPDVTYYICPVLYWPLIESALGIVAACLPLIFPVSQLNSVKQIFRVSSKAISSTLLKFSRSDGRSVRNTSSASRSGDGDRTPIRNTETSNSERWLRPYRLSILEPTVDIENQIEALPLATIRDHNEYSDAIVVQRHQ